MCKISGVDVLAGLDACGCRAMTLGSLVIHSVGSGRADNRRRCCGAGHSAARIVFRAELFQSPGVCMAGDLDRLR